MSLKIAGTGIYLPQTLSPSAVWDKKIGRPEGWLENETGVKSRYIVDRESQIDMAAVAAEAAMQDAGVAAGDIDLILCASAVGYQAIPATATILQQRLGAPEGRVAAFDVNATCLSFVAALDVAAAFFAAGRYRRALIVSAEIASRGLPWRDHPDVAALFSDGAAAAVVEAAPVGDFTAHFTTWPSAWEACQLQAGGTRHNVQTTPMEVFRELALFQMDGPTLFRVVSRRFRRFLDELLERAGLRLEDFDAIVPHQGSPAGLVHVIRQCRFDTQRVVNIAATHGNQIAASIPIALHYARKQGLAKAGGRLLMLGTSAGVSFGGVAMVC